MKAFEFISICNEYGILPALVAEDLVDAGITPINAETLRLFIEVHY